MSFTTIGRCIQSLSDGKALYFTVNIQLVHAFNAYLIVFVTSGDVVLSNGLLHTIILIIV